jgi:hypothetical protein
MIQRIRNNILSPHLAGTVWRRDPFLRNPLFNCPSLEYWMRPGFPGSGSTITDSAGKNNVTSTIVNSASWGASEFGNVPTFNGTNQYVSLNQTLSLNGPVSVWGLVNWNGTNQVGRIYYKDVNGTGDTIMSLYIASQQFNFLCRQLSQVYKVATASTVSTANKWYSVVGVYNKIDLRIYVNGVVAVGASNTSAIPSSGVNPFIGTDGTGSSQYWPGKIAAVALWSRDLQPWEIKLLNPFPHQIGY